MNKCAVYQVLEFIRSFSDKRGEKRKHDEEESDDDQAHDEVRLWEDGFKDRYYESKFDVAPKQLEFR